MQKLLNLAKNNFCDIFHKMTWTIAKNVKGQFSNYLTEISCSVQLVPKHLSDSARLRAKMTSSRYVSPSRTKYLNESETDYIVSSNTYFVSEKLLTTKNGCRGTYFARSLNSKFLKGWTHRAVVLNTAHSWQLLNILSLKHYQWRCKMLFLARWSDVWQLFAKILIDRYRIYRLWTGQGQSLFVLITPVSFFRADNNQTTTSPKTNLQKSKDQHFSHKWELMAFSGSPFQQLTYLTNDVYIYTWAIKTAITCFFLQTRLCVH